MASLRKWDSAESRHIVVLYKGVWYRVQLSTASGKPLSMFQLQSILQGAPATRPAALRMRSTLGSDTVCGRRCSVSGQWVS